MFDSPNGLVVTTRQVMQEGWPILLVTHDELGWQFVNGHGDTDERANGIPVHVEHVVERDPSIAELADLPAGWHAWRESEDAPWVRKPD